MRRTAVALFLAAGEALAHPGHGTPHVHLHWWEYALLAAAVGALVAWAARR
jgi:hypothetical protein